MGDVNTERALVPIAEAMPELRADAYAKVREWDAARMALAGEYEAADGEYLKKIRDELKPKHGMWYAYLRVRGIPDRTAQERIQKAEGRFIPSPRMKPAVTAGLPEPTPQPIVTPDSYRIPSGSHVYEHAYDDEPPIPAMWTEVHEDEPQPTPPTWQPADRDESEHIEADVVPSVTTFSIEAWNELHPDARLSVIEEGREGRAGLNQQKSDSIEWAQWSWNPITGCLHECPYCYARDIANRFYPQGFKPTFHPFRLGAPAHQHVPSQAETELGYRNIFTCSMADLFGKWVPTEWIQAVLNVVEDNPQWNFLFLTKFPVRLAQFTFPDNAWIGTSVDCQARVKNAERSFAKVKGGVKWLSIEPMLENIRFTSLDMFNWVVIGGASSSTETPAWIPPRRWVLDLESQARDAGCMIYEKTNLGIQGPSRLREYPGWQRAEQRLPDALAYLPSIEQGGSK